MAYPLPPAARQVFNQFIALSAKAYSAEPGQEFTATPMVENTLIKKLVENGGWFMPYLTIMLVRQLKGEKIAMSVSGGSATRTKIVGNAKRQARNLIQLINANYELFEVDNDIRVLYATLDAWSEFPNFADLFNTLVKEAMANDIIRVGWNGTTTADTTDIATNPDMSDLLVGWLQIMREFNSGSNYLDGASTGIVLGSRQYPTLDSVVNELKYTIPVHLRDGLIAMVSDDLMGYSEGQYYRSPEMTEAKKAMIESGRQIVTTYGGLPAVVPPFFIDGGILLTTPGNLQYYMQRGSIRRTIRDEPDYSSVADYNSCNGGYVVYNEEQAVFADGITVA
ncbi:P2 family phage major capsid protein [Methylovulum psychrotolerans]|uniref:Phage major capsid protein, P2 family n=1 Tax=Methylovulum psychrotolerans TaxID=1704499 RepID=A0A2S5CGF3_9GAMM|nr:P2 family phage major capsid protein [Methylovulum psychrotolerans]POZ49893.1 hypothetical protein AADEFJLK_04339 [Methylovulum psychrotolerans]